MYFMYITFIVLYCITYMLRGAEEIIYSRLSLSRIPRDSLKHFEISVPRHIRVAKVRKTINWTTAINMWICNLTPEVRNIYKIMWKRGKIGGWSGGAKVSCTSRHRGVQLILAYSWARPAILVAGKGRRGMFLIDLFLHFHSCSSFFPVLSFISSTISSISFLPFSGRRHKMTHKDWRVVKPQHNQ